MSSSTALAMTTASTAARTLGMVAVQVLRPGVIASPEVCWRVPDLDALPALLAKLGDPGAA